MPRMQSQSPEAPLNNRAADPRKRVLPAPDGVVVVHALHEHVVVLVLHARLLEGLGALCFGLLVQIPCRVLFMLLLRVRCANRVVTSFSEKRLDLGPPRQEAAKTAPIRSDRKICELSTLA